MKTEDTTINAFSLREFCEWARVSYLGSPMRTKQMDKETSSLAVPQEPTTYILKMSEQIKGLCWGKIQY